MTAVIGADGGAGLASRDGVVTWGALFTLLALRYRLLGAYVRSRNGRLVLLVAGGLLGMSFGVLLALGGFGAAAAAVRVGRGEFVAQLILVAVFINATLGAVFLGIGVSPIFSEGWLRRYPISTLGRTVARHLTALLEPVWILVFMLLAGMAGAFSTSGISSSWLALPAVVLFVVTSYLLACAIARFGSWLLSWPAGRALIFLAGGMVLMMAPFAPALLARGAARQGGLLPGAGLFALTPPFAAAAAIAGAEPGRVLDGLTLLIGWTVAMSGLLFLLERLPLHTGIVANANARWSHPCDVVASVLGPMRAPIAGKFLRDYLRSSVRFNYPFALPVLALLSSNYEGPPFFFALGVAPVMGFIATVPLSLNLFGFDGAGFRRYFLLPVRAADVFSAAAVTSLLPGATLNLVAVIVWLALTPSPVESRMIAMLLGAGFGGLLLFHALGLCVTLFSPRRIPYGLAFGNKNSAAANVLMVASWALVFGLPWALTGLDLRSVLDVWWATAIFLVIAAVLYLATIRAGAHIFAARREQIIASLEALG